MLALEINYRKGKVDHNDMNTKDVSDAMCGVCYGLTQQREIWAQHKVPINDYVVNQRSNLKETSNVDPRADMPDVLIARSY